MKMRYTTKINIGLTDNTLSFYRFSGNSVFDCDPVGGNKQYAYMFLEYSNTYSEYVVKASSISIQFTGLTGNPSFAVYLLPHYSTTAIAGLQNWPGRKVKLVGDYVGPIGAPKLRHYATTKKVYHMIGIPPRESEYAGGAGASGFGGSSPVNEWFWHLYLDNLDNAGIPSIVVFVKLVYYVTFFNKRGSVYAQEDP